MKVKFSQKLLKWYHSRERPMPWRGETDPYRIWLSEVMLQQTQVVTVIPYYLRWLKNFPTLKNVAESKEDDVLKAWEGLGYYARVRNFRKACIQVVNDHSGKIPKDTESFATLKGVGPYTLAAVQSIAFNKPMPVIDGNVKRVVARLLCLTKPPSQSLDKIEKYLNQVISKKYPGDFNQAIMDLGATVCTAQKPKCQICPVQKECKAFLRNKAYLFPKLEKKIERPHYKIAVGIIWKGNQLLISKRLPTGMLAGLWEFPGGKIEPQETPKACVKREIHEELGVHVRVGKSLGKVKHGYTHFTIEMEGFHCVYISGRPRKLECADFKWIKIADIKKYTFPKANHKLFPRIQSKTIDPIELRKAALL
jgi:A/G-specific adenine glycosylase